MLVISCILDGDECSLYPWIVFVSDVAVMVLKMLEFRRRSKPDFLAKKDIKQQLMSVENQKNEGIHLFSSSVPLLIFEWFNVVIR